MASLSFQLIGSNIYANLSASSNGKSKVFRKKTGLSTNPKHWGTKQSKKSKKKLVDLTKPKMANAKETKKKLDKLKDDVLTQLNKDYAKGIDVDGDWLQFFIDKFFNRFKDKTHTLTYQIQKAIDHAPRKKIRTKGGRFKVGLSRGRIKGIEQFKTIVERFQIDHLKGKKIIVSKIDKEIIKDFENWLFNQDYSVNYVGKQLANLKSILNDIDDIKINIDPSKDIQVISDNKKPEEIIYLSFDELQQIKEADISTNYLNNARKWLILGCHTGQRVSDLLRLSIDKIEMVRGKRVFRIVQQKTGKAVTIPILPEAESIIKGGFPYTLSHTKLREYFKEVCKIAGIDKPTIGRIRQNGKHGTTIKGLYPKWKLIGTHVCRRSFASNYYSSIPTPILISVTGHSSENMFLQYIGKSEEDLAVQMFDYIDKIPQPKVLKLLKTKKNQN